MKIELITFLIAILVVNLLIYLFPKELILYLVGIFLLLALGVSLLLFVKNHLTQNEFVLS